MPEAVEPDLERGRLDPGQRLLDAVPRRTVHLPDEGEGEVKAPLRPASAHPGARPGSRRSPPSGARAAPKPRRAAAPLASSPPLTRAPAPPPSRSGPRLTRCRPAAAQWNPGDRIAGAGMSRPSSPVSVTIDKVTIDPDRLLGDLRRLREFGACGIGVVRQSLTPIDIESRHWLRSRLEPRPASTPASTGSAPCSAARAIPGRPCSSAPTPTPSRGAAGSTGRWGSSTASRWRARSPNARRRSTSRSTSPRGSTRKAPSPPVSGARSSAASSIRGRSAIS